MASPRNGHLTSDNQGIVAPYCGSSISDMPDGPMTLLKHLGTRYRPLWGYNSTGGSTNHLWWSTNLREPWIHCNRLIPSVVYMGSGSIRTLNRNELPLHYAWVLV
ncbi:13393_t:CDS:1 [Rhizophagus irregularis]|nr:13393_t:CDS:1 [Rhizophagus irregularis]